MCLELDRSGPAIVVRVRGEIDLDNAHLLPELVDGLGDLALQRLVLDLAQVTFFGAAGVRALLETRRAVTGKGGRLIVTNPAPVVRAVLAATGVLDEV